MSNRTQRRLRQKIENQVARETIAKLTDRLELQDPSTYPNIPGKHPVHVWLSRNYLVQCYEEHHGVMRLSINRTSRNKGNWNDKITWDELQQIKRECGFGERYAIEIYPQDSEIVNVANMRHLWILPMPLPIGWRK